LPVFDGPGGGSASCVTDSNCKVSGGLRCVLSAGSTSGTCQVPLVMTGGQSCAAPNAQCVPGFHCGGTQHCDADATANQMCDSQNPCGPDLQCSGGICASKSADGTQCASADECLHGICNGSNAGTMGVCVSQLTFAYTVPFCVESR
jgi:hypothetical protein